jgi:hypothetical protein
MKQSFEVFEQSDGVALHLTVTVDSDALATGSCTKAVRELSRSSLPARVAAQAACMTALKPLTNAIRQAIVGAAINADEAHAFDQRQAGATQRQPEVDLLNAQITSLRNQLAELTEAQKATKKPRKPRKTTGNAISARSLPGFDSATRKAARK